MVLLAFEAGGCAGAACKALAAAEADAMRVGGWGFPETSRNNSNNDICHNSTSTSASHSKSKSKRKSKSNCKSKPRRLKATLNSS